MEFTLSITEERFAKLKEMATRLNISPEDLVRISIDDLISRPSNDLQSAADYVLEKNDELYQRLA